jgi:DNA mismatch endonuclease (patch repair protein)
MRRIRGVDTTPELALRKALHAAGLRGWRLYAKELPGKPDVVFRRWRVAVFVDGAFWHGHPSKFSPGRLPKWWEKKILANQARDRRADAELRRLGWRVVRIWDIEVRKNVSKAAARVDRAVLLRSSGSRGAGRAHKGRDR